AKPFAARGNQMAGKLRDQLHIRSRLRQNELIDAGHVAPGKLDQAFDRAPVLLAAFEVHYDTHQELPFFLAPRAGDCMAAANSPASGELARAAPKSNRIAFTRKTRPANVTPMIE